MHSTMTMRSLLIDEPAAMRAFTEMPEVSAITGSFALPLRAASEVEHPAAVPAPLVLVAKLAAFRIYWAADVSTLIVRAMCAARLGAAFDESLTLTAGMIADVGAQALIIDLSEALVLASSALTVGLKLSKARLSCRIAVVSANFYPEAPLPGACLQFRTVQAALEAFKAQVPAPDTLDLISRLMRRRGAGIIVGNYAGCAYWLPKTRTLALVWSGDATASEESDALLSAVSSFIKFLRVEHVICDIRNFLELKGALREKVQAFFDSVVFCDVNYFIIVGCPAILSAPDDPVSALLDVLKNSPALEVLGTFTEALFATGDRAGAAVLDS